MIILLINIVFTAMNARNFYYSKDVLSGIMTFLGLLLVYSSL